MTVQRVQPQWSYNGTDSDAVFLCVQQSYDNDTVSDAVSDTVSETVFLCQVSERQHILLPRERFS